MFSSFGISSSDKSKSKVNFRPVTSEFQAEDALGELDAKDTEWTCAGGFVTETQIFYSNMEDGTFVLCQVIHSSVGLWYPTIQFTCKIYRPDTKEQIWKSVNVSNFTCAPMVGGRQYDRRSSKSDQFSILHKSGDNGEEHYEVTANPSPEIQIHLNVTRVAAGFKFGKGPKGGFSYFGSDFEKPEGYVIHRFWPRTKVEGHIILKGRALASVGHGMFVHAIQGMRPNLVAASWNFADFQSDEHGGVSAIQMEFTTTEGFGRNGSGSGGVVVNIGSLVFGGELVAVTGETRWPNEQTKDTDTAVLRSRATHFEPTFDPDTSYKQPKRILFQWLGRSSKGPVEASLEVDVGGPNDPKGLLEKVDVLAEIPYVIRKFVNYVAGTKPYIYQWLNPVTLKITGPSEVISAGEAMVKGVLFNEATFISK